MVDVDISTLNLNAFGSGENYAERQIKRWTEQYQKSKSENGIPSMEKLIKWLPNNVPSEKYGMSNHI